MDFKTLIRAMSTRPAELLGLPGGTLRAGPPADVVVIDADTPWVLDPADLKSQCKNTPFDEARFSGRVVRTIVGGRTVYEHVCVSSLRQKATDLKVQVAMGRL